MKKRQAPQTEAVQNLERMRAFLRTKGVTKKMFDDFRFNILRASMHESYDIKFDRYMTVFGMALRNVYGFGGERIVKALQEATDLIFQCQEQEDWNILFHKLRNEIGVVVISEKEIRFFRDYIGKDVDEE